MNIAILGGSFDPPHRGHIIIAKKLLKLLDLDSVWLMPCYQHPFNKNLSSPNQRLEMVKYLESDNIKVSDFEIRKKTTSYAIDTLKQLTDNFPKNKFFWIIGNDQISTFTKWKKWKEIINNFKLIVIPRINSKIIESDIKNIINQVKFPGNIIKIDKNDFPTIYLSSTFIRKKIKENKSISNMVPKKVQKYIMQNKLYF
jgi:nicotinate-nucleotide adenylyltransferase